MSSCPLQCVERNVSFWNAASEFFAQKAQGDVHVVLNGTRSSISTNSIFYNIELPNFNSVSISSVKVILLNKMGIEPFETCENPKSINILIDSLAQKNISYECEDNTSQIISLFCLSDPYSRECQLIRHYLNSARLNNYNLFMCITFITFIFLDKSVNKIFIVYFFIFFIKIRSI